MPAFRNDALLPLGLRLDAVASGALDALLLATAAPAAPYVGLPTDTLRLAGLALVPWALAVWTVAARRPTSRGAVGVVIALNAAWVVGSVAMLEQPTLTALGTLGVAAQALAVAAFAALQLVGLRRARPHAGVLAR